MSFKTRACRSGVQICYVPTVTITQNLNIHRLFSGSESPHKRKITVPAHHSKGGAKCIPVENKRLNLYNFLPVPGLLVFVILIRHALVCFIMLECRLTGRTEQGDKQLHQTICGTNLKLNGVVLGYYHVTLSIFIQ